MMDIEDTMLNSLDTADFNGFIKIGAEYSDRVTKASKEAESSINGLLTEFEESKKINIIEANNGNYIDSYYEIYNELAE